MIPNINPKMMQQAMKKMGMQQEEIPATEVIIKTPDKDLVIKNPQVSKIKMMGQETFQIVGEVEEVAAEKFSAADIETVAAQAKVSKKEAKEALEKSNGDLAEAILLFEKE